MRKLTILCFLLLFGTASFSQETKPSTSLTKEELLSKSKSQKTFAFILLGVGVVTIAILAPGKTDLDAVGPLAIGSGLCIIGSIPLFIASAKNKRKAMNASAFIEMQRIPQMKQGGINMQPTPAIGVKISLN